ncbi:MAG: hypothetical protein QOD99_1212 [Chthoniobacter sp.]|jgi:glucose-6-phosphate dehydrogenase assembly protein OpcA|nr:hypothetical protein [Chthoniobacter sp.]
MPETIANLGSGMPVEIGKIDRELKKLWDSGEGTTTRASLINFAIYCEGAERMAENTQIISEFTRDHACRAILIATEPNAPELRVQASISAHCHVSRAGAKQVCCEQISFLLEGNSKDMIPNIVFSHLDSDLPLYLWWRGDFSRHIDAQLWIWVDRLIFDSQKWREPKAQFVRLRESLAAIKPRMILCDLNWTRLLHLRWAAAQLFDHPGNLVELQKVTHVEAAHAPKHRTTALLFLGWLMAQLRWRMSEKRENGFLLVGDQGQITVELRELAGAPISEFSLQSAGARFRISRETSSDFFKSQIELSDGRAYHHLVPSGKDTLIDLLNEELMLGGKHPVYMKALTAAESLL